MSTTGKEYKLAIRIAGIIDKSFTTSLAVANSSLKKTIASMDTDFTKLDKGFDKIVNVGQKCFSALTTAAGVAAAAITAATAASIAVGTEFESAFAGVKKTVDATAEGYEKLRQDILEMSRVMPSSAAEIAGVMEIAGQLGIATESLTDFTETMINLGVSTNLSADEAATALAKFSNITSMADYGADGISNFERLGSVVVDLGNNFATTEADIVAMATNLAASGDLAGLTEAQIMAISTAMSAVGIAAEAGGSSMSRVLMQMQQAVATGSDDLSVYAKTAGITSKEFAALFRDDAGEALTLFIEGLGDAGEDGYEILEDLSLSTIRVRKALLSLAGADGLLGETMDLANEAWKENTALAIEAGKRYETTESRLQIMQNAFKELGIVAYDDLRDPFIDVISTITDKVRGFTEYVGGPSGISEWLDNIGTELPTLQRKFKKYGEPVFNGIMGAGKWIVKNKNGLISTFLGIGSALATYKTASTLTHVVKALMTLGSMNPVTLGILGVVSAIGLLTTGIAAYKQHERDLINSSLREHFGDIALSMEDIQRVAEYIVSTDSLGGVKEAMEAFGELDTLAGTMENAIEEINKMNWKVSIGMELTGDEQESYKAAIEEYVSAAQDYALQSGYAVSLNLAVGMGGSGENADIVSKVNQFYQDSYDEMVTLGEDLSQAVNDAFADNILDPKEIDSIVNLQAKMADLQKSLATGEFEAQLSMLGMEYAGGNLTADSFQNLQAELATQVENATAAYKEAYAKNYAAIQATYDAGGYLTDAEYQAALDTIQEEYLKNVGDLQAKALNFQLGTIMQQYGGEVAAFKEIVGSVFEEFTGDTYASGWETTPVPMLQSMMQAIFQDEAVDKTTKKAIGELLAAMQPTVEQAEALKQQYADLGIELSDELQAAFANFDLLGAMTTYQKLYGQGGDMDALASHLYSIIVNNEEYAQIEEILRGYGWELPEALSDGVYEAAQQAIRPAVEGMYAWSQQAIDEYYSQGFTTEADVSIQLNPTLNGLRSWSLLNGINHRANGGLATSPELTWFAENGPEMAIPIDGSRNAISLWEQTGRLLGMESVLDTYDLSGSSSGPTIEYSPTLQFYGEAPNRGDLEDALRVSQDEFESLMERYFKTHGRVSFG